MRYLLVVAILLGVAEDVCIAKDSHDSHPSAVSSTDNVSVNETEPSHQTDGQAATVEALSQMVQAAMQRELEVRVQLNAEIATTRALKSELQETKDALRQEKAKPTPKCSP